jgi:mRNA-degrading endonuclease toxin of MazEF toxin-antitoxin module
MSINGLRRASVVLVFQLTAVDNRSIAGRLGTVSSEMLKEVWAAFDKLIGRAQVCRRNLMSISRMYAS